MVCETAGRNCIDGVVIDDDGVVGDVDDKNSIFIANYVVVDDNDVVDDVPQHNKIKKKNRWYLISLV